MCRAYLFLAFCNFMLHMEHIIPIYRVRRTGSEHVQNLFVYCTQQLYAPHGAPCSHIATAYILCLTLERQDVDSGTSSRDAPLCAMEFSPCLTPGDTSPGKVSRAVPVLRKQSWSGVFTRDGGVPGSIKGWVSRSCASASDLCDGCLFRSAHRSWRAACQRVATRTARKHTSGYRRSSQPGCAPGAAEIVVLHVYDAQPCVRCDHIYNGPLGGSLAA